ncbi:MAG: B12-binding domain-containing radical SAM protein [Candidatus Thorarchaeota archaeon]|jgi:radical SAM superfamily enzyme YgiQ (UPF0313 family)
MDTKIPLFRCLGVLALSSALNFKSIEVEVLDLSNLNVGDISDYDEALDKVIDTIVSTNPEILGLSTMSNNIVVALEICRRIKKVDSDIVTILGGPGASFSAKEILESFKQVDIIVRGEADISFPELIVQIQSNGSIIPIKGVVYREGDQILDNGWSVPIENLDSLPIPNYEICSKDEDVEEAASIEMGRGCPFACTFCSTSSYFKRKFRMKSVDRVHSEIKLVQEKFGEKRRIKMNHDLLTFNRKYIISLCDALSELDTPIIWGCSARLDTLDDEILSRMKDVGCDRIYLGIETVTERMQEIINKRLDLTKLDETLRVAVELGFTLVLSFVIGFPEETDDDLNALWEFIFRAKSIHLLKVKIQVHSLVPEPGSKLFDTMKDNLVYDDYGGPGHSDFPPIHWTELREIIKNHPEIFPTYYYIESQTIQRQNILKHVFLGQAVDGFSKSSLQFAYSLFGSRVPKTMIENIDGIELPLPSWPGMDYRGTMNSIQRILSSLFEDEDSRLQYESIVKAELANVEVARNRPDHSEFIEVWYHPLHHMRKVTGLEYDPEQLDKRLRTVCVYWDEKAQGIGYSELTDDLVKLRGLSKKG